MVLLFIFHFDPWASGVTGRQLKLHITDAADFFSARFGCLGSFEYLKRFVCS